MSTVQSEFNEALEKFNSFIGRYLQFLDAVPGSHEESVKTISELIQVGSNKNVGIITFCLKHLLEDCIPLDMFNDVLRMVLVPQ